MQTGLCRDQEVVNIYCPFRHHQCTTRLAQPNLEGGRDDTLSSLCHRCCTKAKWCESCKVEFVRGGVVCIPHDIAFLHMERYLYPKKDANGTFLHMEPTWNKETERFYCANKKCIIQRHPYFWKGMLKIASDTSTRFKEGHLKHPKEMFHFIV